MPNSKEQYWYFTFGSAHAHPNGYIKIYGTFDASRMKMVERFGEKWAFQYRSSDDAGVKRFNLYEVR